MKYIPDIEWLKRERNIAALITALDHSFHVVRRDAARALGELKSRRALQPLQDCLQDADSSVRKAVRLALAAFAQPQLPIRPKKRKKRTTNNRISTIKSQLNDDSHYGMPLTSIRRASADVPILPSKQETAFIDLGGTGIMLPALVEFLIAALSRAQSLHEVEIRAEGPTTYRIAGSVITDSNAMDDTHNLHFEIRRRPERDYDPSLDPPFLLTFNATQEESKLILTVEYFSTPFSFIGDMNRQIVLLIREETEHRKRPLKSASHTKRHPAAVQSISGLTVLDKDQVCDELQRYIGSNTRQFIVHLDSKCLDVRTEIAQEYTILAISAFFGLFGRSNPETILKRARSNSLLGKQLKGFQPKVTVRMKLYGLRCLIFISSGSALTAIDEFLSIYGISTRVLGDRIVIDPFDVAISQFHNSFPDYRTVRNIGLNEGRLTISQ